MTEYSEGGLWYDVKVIFDGAYLQAEQDHAGDPEWKAACEVYRWARVGLLDHLIEKVARDWFTMNVAADEAGARRVLNWPAERRRSPQHQARRVSMPCCTPARGCS